MVFIHRLGHSRTRRNRLVRRSHSHRRLNMRTVNFFLSYKGID